MMNSMENIHTDIRALRVKVPIRTSVWTFCYLP